VDATPDRDRLTGYVEVWWGAVGDLLALLEELEPEDWQRPTDLPGWDVHACAAHTAHLEAILVGAPEETIQFDPPDHATSLMALYTEQGVVARRDRTPAELIEEIRSTTTARHDRLLAEPPTDPTASPDVPFAQQLGWDVARLLRNRPLDVWMHEQDIRRAVGRPGSMDSPAAVHTADYLAESLGMVLGKRVAAAPGTTAVLRVDGHEPKAFVVDKSGRGVRLDDLPADPTVELAMDRESFIVLAGGRRTPEPGAVRIDGDEDLGRRILESLAVTP